VVKQRLKRLLFQFLGKDPEAVVVSFWTGEDALAARMVDEVQRLAPERRHFVVRLEELEPGSPLALWLQLRRRFRRYRIGLAPVLFTAQPHPLRAAAALLAPGKILAYNSSLERHHLQLRSAIASLLFLRDVPLDRIFLRPRWLVPWKKDRSVFPETYRVMDGRPFTPGQPRVALLSPYFPYPLSHGGAVRIYNLLRETAREFDVSLFAFSDRETDDDLRHMARWCSRMVIVPRPRYREPRWSTLLPPEVREFSSPGMRAALRRFSDYDLLQVEYTQLARYGGDILVEHDITFDLYQQVARRQRTFSAWWDLVRWRRFEARAAARFRSVVVMSSKDARLLAPFARSTVVIENGVDLERFQPVPEQDGQELLFIGSFRHFPNVAAYRFFAEQIWPALRERYPRLRFTAVCGPDHRRYYDPAAEDRISVHGFVADVRPLYAAANLVLAPTTVSAGTNLKVLEAMAMQRAVVSTPSGCAGLGLRHGETVWVAKSAADFVEGAARLLDDASLRLRIAREARAFAEQNYGWVALGEKQRACYRELLKQKRPS
jgi:glycosyltransferase involved in cell wall biosynthesis